MKSNPYFLFLQRFSKEKIQAPVLPSTCKSFQTLHETCGVGWFGSTLLHILDPIFIPDIKQALDLENKIPFACNAFGEIYSLGTNQKINFHSFFENKTEIIAEDINSFLLKKLYTDGYQASIRYDLSRGCKRIYGLLNTSQVFVPKLHPLLGGDLKPTNFAKGDLLHFLLESHKIQKQINLL